MHARIDLRHPGLVPEVAAAIREARALAGWSQRELAARSETSQSTVSRIERGEAREPDLLVIERILTALGIRVTLDISGRHLEDRRRQSDFVHGVTAGFIGRRFRRDGWLIANEVQIGDRAPRGWIDLLAFRESDASLVVEETKSGILDAGGLLRQVGFYQREAANAARRLGWRAEWTTVLVVALDTDVVARTIHANRDLLASAFPTAPRALTAWIQDPGKPRPRGWTLATADPRDRGAIWLRSSALGERRRPAAFLDYADAANALAARELVRHNARSFRTSR